jgi:hypothetical protein
LFTSKIIPEKLGDRPGLYEENQSKSIGEMLTRRTFKISGLRGFLCRSFWLPGSVSFALHFETARKSAIVV